MIRFARQKTDSESGFTLIELVAAMAIFALAAGAVLSVIVSGIRTAGFSRDRTLGKDLARQQLEDMRRLPFFIPQATFDRKADVLDFYYPDAGNPSPACPAVPGCYNNTNPADPFYRVSNPVNGFPRFRVQVDTRLVNEDLATVVPPTGYRYNDIGLNSAPAQLVSVELTVFWTVSGRPNSFTIKSQIGATSGEQIIVQGTVTASLLRTDTEFQDGSNYTAEAGKAVSTVYVGNITTSRNETSTALGKISFPSGSVTELLGGSLVALAPSDTGPLATTVTSDQLLVHPSYGLQVMRIGSPAKLDLVEAKVAAIPPASQGRMLIKDTGADEDVAFSATNRYFNGVKHLDATKPFVSVVRKNASRPLVLRTSCAQTDTAPEKVTCQVDNGIVDLLRTIPTNFSALGVPPQTENNGYVLGIRFTELKVKAVASKAGVANASATADFEAIVSYWTFVGGIWTKVDLPTIRDGQSNVLPDPSTICIVVDLGVCKVPLSDYVTAWPVLDSGVVSITDSGRTVTSTLPGAMKIFTLPTDATVAGTGFTITVGTMSATAVDKR